jgi:hypothetical protein
MAMFLSDVADARRLGPLLAICTATSSPTATPKRAGEVLPRVNPVPAPAGSMTARTPLPLTVPAMW